MADETKSCGPVREPLVEDGRFVGVIAAMRRGDGRLLCVRRAAGCERAPLKIGMPGGTVEVGETQPQALVREMREELAIVARPVQPFWRIDLPDRPWRLIGWIAEIVEGDIRPDPAEIAEVLWLSGEEAAGHPDALSTMAQMVAALARAR